MDIEQRAAEVMKRVREKGHTATSDAELRMTARMVVSRNPAKTDEEIADMIAEALGVMGSSTAATGGEFKEGDASKDEQLNDKTIYDKYTKDAWTPDKL